MSHQQVITSQPVPASAPFEEPPPYTPSVDQPPPYVPPLRITAPLPSSLDDVITDQPVLDADGQEMLTRADAAKSDAEEELRRRRNEDFCCYACADSCDGDIWCWYFFWRLYCNCLGQCCEAISHCTDSCCEGCASCLQGCCCDSGDDGPQADDGCCDGDCCCGDGGCCGDGDCCCGDGGCCGDGDCCGDCGDCDCDCSGCFN